MMHSSRSLPIWVCTQTVARRVISFAAVAWIAFPLSLFIMSPRLLAEEPKSIPSAIQSAKPLSQARSLFVHSPRATVRCGPSDEYYATATLDRGTPVDVYLESAEGWSGIRPPEGSHDWIPAESVYLLPGGRVAEVSVDRVAAWVGSEMLKNETLLYQTELIKTQTVSILGEAYRGPEADRKLWLKIAPPPGEFRWVRTSQLGSEPIAPSQRAATPPLSKANSEASMTGSGVKRASYQPPSGNLAKSPSEPEKEITPGAGQEGQVVWSDEAEQLAKVDREIQREQSALERNARGSGPMRPSNPLAPSKPSSSTKVKTRVATAPARTSQTTQPRLTQPRPSPTHAGESSRIQRGNTESSQLGSMVAASSGPQTMAVTEGEDRYWRAMRRQSASRNNAGSEDGGAMDNVLGLLGVSVLEPESPSQQPSRMQPIPRDHARGMASRGANESVASLLKRYDPTQAGSSRVDRLPKPRSRIAPSPRANSFAERATNASNMLESLLTSREPLWGGRPDEATATSSVPYDEAEVDEATANTRPRGPLVYSASYANQPAGPISAASTRGVIHSEGNHTPAMDELEQFQSPQIQEVLLQLSSIVSLPTQEWKLGPIRDTAVFWIERGETPLVRGEARLLLERIERFESLRLRTMAFNGPAPVASVALTANGQALPQAPGSGTPYNAPPAEFSLSNASTTNYIPRAPYTEAVPQRTTTSNSEFSGWLVAVHTSVAGQPEFALTDNAGNVIAYVRPTTGLNLRRYLQQPVTIFGTPGYLPNLAAKQILAERVVRIR